MRNHDPYITFAGSDDCDVDIPNEFLTVTFTRRPSGELSHFVGRWSSDSLNEPSKQALAEAHGLACRHFEETADALG